MIDYLIDNQARDDLMVLAVFAASMVFIAGSVMWSSSRGGEYVQPGE